MDREIEIERDRHVTSLWVWSKSKYALVLRGLPLGSRRPSSISSFTVDLDISAWVFESNNRLDSM